MPKNVKTLNKYLIIKEKYGTIIIGDNNVCRK